MESLIASGMVAGVLDITTTEWADELVGGVLTAGPERLDATARAKIPAIVTPGCLDMVNFGERASVPAKFAGRQFYQHNPQVTLMRTTPAECAELGRILAEKINRYSAPVTVLIPRRAFEDILQNLLRNALQAIPSATTMPRRYIASITNPDNCRKPKKVTAGMQAAIKSV